MKNTIFSLLLVLSGFGCLPWFDSCQVLALEPGSLIRIAQISPTDSTDIEKKSEASNSSSKADRIKGSVRGAAVLTSDGLRKIADTSAVIKRVAELIAGEVNRKDEVVTKVPNFVPGGGVIPPVPQPSGTMLAGDLPARKEVLDRFMRQISYKVELLHNTIDALIIPPDRQKDLEPLWAKIKLNMIELQKHYELLSAATREPPYNKTKIGRAALSVFDCAERIEKLRKKAYKRLRRK